MTDVIKPDNNSNSDQSQPSENKPRTRAPLTYAQTAALTPAKPSRPGYGDPTDSQKKRLAHRLKVEEHEENKRLRREVSPLRAYELDSAVGE